MIQYKVLADKIRPKIVNKLHLRVSDALAYHSLSVRPLGCLVLMFACRDIVGYRVA